MTQRTPAPETREDPHARRAPHRTLRTSDRAARRGRRPDLERQSISFTVGLYLFICVALLLAHVTAGGV